MTDFALTGLHHVQLALPRDAEDQARAFYAGLLGLREITKPAALAGRGGVWFEGRGISLHLGVEHPFTPARKAHPAFAVDDLAAARAALATVSPSPVSRLPGMQRFYITDPFGNRIEIVQPD